jgi:hypothetical protein
MPDFRGYPPRERPGADKPRVKDVVGLDLGQAADPTAIVVLRRTIETGKSPMFQVGHLERLPLNTPYPQVIRYVRGFVTDPALVDVELVLDFTGVGRPIYDAFLEYGLFPTGVTITSGDTQVRDDATTTWRIGKEVLVSHARKLFENQQLQIPRDMPEASALIDELLAFQASIMESGRWRYGARAGKHDDLVLALAIAAWRFSTGGGLTEWLD